jgi:hypothetical protein
MAAAPQFRTSSDVLAPFPENLSRTGTDYLTDNIDNRLAIEQPKRRHRLKPVRLQSGISLLGTKPGTG